MHWPPIAVENTVCYSVITQCGFAGLLEDNTRLNGDFRAAMKQLEREQNYKKGYVNWKFTVRNCKHRWNVQQTTGMQLTAIVSRRSGKAAEFRERVY